MDLWYSMTFASREKKCDKHPQKVMECLGIKYKKAIPQSIADGWQFLGCENVPERLPVYLKKIKRN